jgi:hypothetical protein
VSYDKGNFLKQFMVEGAISGRGNLPPIKVPPKAKINADYYISHVLKSICKEFLSNIYPPDPSKVISHHDATTSHTARKTQWYPQRVKEKLGITINPNKKIQVKSCDASPLDFFGFEFLKSTLYEKLQFMVEDCLWSCNSL